MAHKTDFDATGAGKAPVLGRSKPEGLAKGTRDMGDSGGSQTVDEIPKVAGPGGQLGDRKASSGGNPPTVARPADFVLSQAAKAQKS